MVVNFKVFKKSSPNEKVTLYLGKRDFVDHISGVEPIGKVAGGALPSRPLMPGCLHAACAPLCSAVLYRVVYRLVYSAVQMAW